MYSPNGLSFPSADRQYLITTDDEDDLKLSHSRGYKIREFTFNFPPYKRVLNGLDDNLDVESGALLSKDLKNNAIPVMLLSGNNQVDPIDSYAASKTTQTSVIVQEQGVNTFIRVFSISTQTMDENISQSDCNTCDSANEIEISSSSPCNDRADSKLLTYANKMAKVLRVETPETTNTSRSNIDEFSDKQSVIFTYSLDNSRHSKSYYIDYSKSSCSSTSCEDLRSASDSDFPQNNSSLKDTELTNDNDMILYLDQECVRYCYLPIDVSNQTASSITWDCFKVYELKKFDEIIRSHENRFDRRLKAISNRMCCKIEIIGPYNPYVPSYNGRNIVELYKLCIYSNTALRLEKSINCIQLSFPNSCFNEKLFKPSPNPIRY